MPKDSKHHHKKKKHSDRESKSSHKKHRSRNSRSRSRSRSRIRTVSPLHKTVKFLNDLEERRLKDHYNRKKLKEELKANETTEEKRTRRLLEKEAKEARRRQRMGWDTEYQNYTNQDNPFGDSNLMASFVWGKKLAKEGLTGVSQETVEVLSRQKQMENKLELEKLKKRRVEREIERQKHEDELTSLQRSKESTQFREWEKQEEQFHLEQARLRSVIRIRDGRAKPIDLLAQYVSNSKIEETIDMQMHEPYMILDGLSLKDLKDLLADIKVYVEVENGKNIEFWDDMTVIVEDKLIKFSRTKEEDYTSMIGRRDSIHQNVIKDVSEIFRGKSTTELNQLRKRIEEKIKDRNDGVDISYWESLLSQIKAHMARSRLRERHQSNLREKLMLLKSTNDDIEDDFPTTSTKMLPPQSIEIKEENTEVMEVEVPDTEFECTIEDAIRLYEEGNYSPTYENISEFSNLKLITQEEDDENLRVLRYKVLASLNKESYEVDDSSMLAVARKGMTADEEEFSVETVIDSPMQMSTDKYRPRKPRYFNRVHTGFEWNKYNQTHYDMDNPPPKIVQGYKFNIFYPDLIDKSVTPKYFLSPCVDNADFAVLRFHAGPPYEDIAFKIVNREWEFSYKRGFRCQFHNNIFQLWFHFKRYRYRR